LNLPVTATGSTTARTLADWMSYLNGVSNPNPVVFGSTVTMPGGPEWFSNYNSSGFPALQIPTNSRLLIQRPYGTDSNTDYTLLQIIRDTTYLTAAANSAINQAVVIQHKSGVNDGAQEWVLGVYANTDGTAGGGVVGITSHVIKNNGATDGVIGLLSEVIDASDKASSLTGTGSATTEFDYDANGLDDGANSTIFSGKGTRVGLHMVAQRYVGTDTSQFSVHSGINFSTQIYAGYGYDAHTNWDSLINVGLNNQMFAGLDDRGSIIPTGYSFPVATVTMQQGHVIDFDGSANTAVNQAPKRYLQYNGSNLGYYNNGSVVFNIDDSGNTYSWGSTTSGLSFANQININGASAGTTPTVNAQGSDTNLGISYNAKGTGRHNFNAPVSINGFNTLLIQAAATGSQPSLTAFGGDATVAIRYNSVNGGYHIFNAPVQANGSTNGLALIGSSTGNAVTLTPVAGDSNISINYTAIGTGSHNFNNSVNINGTTAISLSATTGFVNFPATNGIPTGTPATNLNSCAIDITNGYLNCYYGGAWHKIAFAAGAG
jgi:hypothetical protein